MGSAGTFWCPAECCIPKVEIMQRKYLLVLALTGLAACGKEERARPAAEAPLVRVVDSTRSRESALAEFRRPLPEVVRLSGGARSRDQLVHGFVEALKRRDTAALRQSILTKAEFAWLYYPTAREANPPYSLSPDLMWFTHEGHSEQGIKVALEERGGRPLGYLRYHCAPGPRIEGENRLWGFCVITRALPSGGTTDEQLFGLIVERDGVFKFVSYANQLD